MTINIDIDICILLLFERTSMPTLVIFHHLVPFPWKNMLLLFIYLFGNYSIRRLFRFVTLSSYHGPVTYDKRLLMHQCDIETLIHCTGK
jgi:hypothetical protein